MGCRLVGFPPPGVGWGRGGKGPGDLENHDTYHVFGTMARFGPSWTRTPELRKRQKSWEGSLRSQKRPPRRAHSDASEGALGSFRAPMGARGGARKTVKSDGGFAPNGVGVVCWATRVQLYGINGSLLEAILSLLWFLMHFGCLRGDLRKVMEGLLRDPFWEPCLGGPGSQ